MYPFPVLPSNLRMYFILLSLKSMASFFTKCYYMNVCICIEIYIYIPNITTWKYITLISCVFLYWPLVLDKQLVYFFLWRTIYLCSQLYSVETKILKVELRLVDWHVSRSFHCSTHIWAVILASLPENKFPWQQTVSCTISNEEGNQQSHPATMLINSIIHQSVTQQVL